eukprot:CAMPEP_0184695260 /NCGR_PEP_ID=MMETSP0313-20130426/2961_1 /TAXON_ID=2792 /ORGANISM="Porphyridium aerugineum, Strain SAG 1380-2" /LENGTH=295 /DNA_ID=CAMNT_0027153691 /DNA_START=396 /DNA_END=1283 /DNA_ORIENTATION=+
MAQPQQQQQQRYRRIPIDFLLNHDDEPVAPKWQVRAVVNEPTQAQLPCHALNMDAVMYATSMAGLAQQQQQKTVCFSQYPYQNQYYASPVSTSPPIHSLKPARMTPYIISNISSASNSEYQSQLPTPRQEAQESVDASALDNAEDRSFDSEYGSKMEKKLSAGSASGSGVGSQGISKKKQATARRKWTAEEDEILRQAVKKYGLKNWKYISTLFPGRNGDRVRLRYQYYLMYPENVRQREFTPEEDELILREMDQKTHRWALLSEQFGRSAIAIKNRSHVIKRKLRTESDITRLN